MPLHRQPEHTRAGGKCQSGGVKKVQRIHATIVKSITPMPINIPPTKIVNKLASIIAPLRVWPLEYRKQYRIHGRMQNQCIHRIT